MYGRIKLKLYNFFKRNYVHKKFYIGSEFSEHSESKDVYFHDLTAKLAIEIFPKRERAFRDEMYQNLYALCSSSNVVTFFDIGAYVGLYCLDFHSITGLRIVAVEADPVNYNTLCMNLSSCTRTTAINRAVVDDSYVSDDGFVRISNGGTGSSVPIKHDECNLGTSVKLNSITLDQLLESSCEKDDPVALLMDIEGHEGSILLNQLCSTDFNVVLVAVELHQKQLRKKGFQLTDIFDGMRRAGFSLKWIRVPEKGPDMHGQTHAIFKKNDSINP